MKIRRHSFWLVVSVCLLSSVGPSRASHLDGDPGSSTFTPTFNAATEYGQVNQFSGLSMRVLQDDHEDEIETYEATIPSGWRFPFASIKESALAGCKDATAIPGPPTGLDANMEVVGTAVIALHTDATRNPGTDPNAPGTGPGAAVYNGFLWFHSWDESSSTATLCGFVETLNGRIPGDVFSSDLGPASDRRLMFEVFVTRESDGSWTVTWDFDAVSGAPAGDRSVTDDPRFTAGNVSILDTQLKLSRATTGNYNTDSAGNKTKLLFARNPGVPGQYVVRAVLTPCPQADAGACDSEASPALRESMVPITLRVPEGFHPVARLTAPRRFAVIQDTDDVMVRWDQPETTSADDVKGYVLIVSPPDPVPGNVAKFHTRYLVTDPSDPEYVASSDPCAPDGASVSCAWTLHFPLPMGGGGAYPADGLFAISLITIFADGHRSDGRCDDGSILGAPIPCADGSAPASTPPGYSFTEFVITPDAWQFTYRDVAYGQRGLHAAYVLMVDFSSKRFQYVIWQPLGRASFHPRSGQGVLGVDAGVGVIAHLDPLGTISMEAVVTPTDAIGLVHFGSLTSPTGIQTQLFCGTRLVPPAPSDEDQSSVCRTIRVLRGAPPE